MLALRWIPFAALGAIAIACGGPLETKSPTSTDQKTASSVPPAASSPVPPESSADPICGSGWRWSGTHCAPANMANAEGSPTSTASGASTHPPVSHGPHVTIEEIKVGSGAEAHDGSRVKVHYVGKLADGTVFDSSRDRGQPFSFTIGLGEVIHGFDDGVTGMKVGGVRKVTIPPSLGYGRRGAPPKIPPDATLTFELELLGVE